MDLFSESFVPSLFGLLRADSEESLQAAKTKMDTTLKVGVKHPNNQTSRCDCMLCSSFQNTTVSKQVSCRFLCSLEYAHAICLPRHACHTLTCSTRTEAAVRAYPVHPTQIMVVKQQVLACIKTTAQLMLMIAVSNKAG